MLIVAVYQSEIQPELDKVTKSLGKPEGTSQTGGEKAGAQSAGNQLVEAASHDASIRHPSEVLIEFKVK